MTKENELIQQAEFNPKIKSYIFWAVVFFITVTVIGIPLLLIWVLGLGQYVSRRYYENLKCKLTSKHLEFKKGMMFKVEKTIPLENIQDLTFIENPFLKFFDLRILKIETAGQSNPHGSDMKLIGIIESADFKKKVLNQRDLLQSEGKSSTETSESLSQQTVDLLKEIRDILKEKN